MKRIFAICAVLLAFAAPVRAQSAAPVPDWSGFYLGGTAGGGWGKSYLTATDAWSFHTDGFVGGGTAGYGWQAGPWVVGIETDFSFSNLKGTTPVAGQDCSPQCEVKTRWFGTARARIGYAVGNLMPYITGGLAYANIVADDSNDKLGLVSGSDTRTSGTIGAGLEWLIGPQWSAKVEYLHFDFGKFVYAADAFPTTPGNPATSGEASTRFDTVRIGINYRFGTR